jgi:hypothetical protein
MIPDRFYGQMKGCVMQNILAKTDCYTHTFNNHEGTLYSHDSNVWKFMVYWRYCFCIWTCCLLKNHILCWMLTTTWLRMLWTDEYNSSDQVLLRKIRHVPILYVTISLHFFSQCLGFWFIHSHLLLHTLKLQSFSLRHYFIKQNVHISALPSLQWYFIYIRSQSMSTDLFPYNTQSVLLSGTMHGPL